MTQQYGKNDGPLGKAPDISIGASDAVILAISFAGFCTLAWSVYSIILTKVKTARELQQEAEEREVSYDERLAQADVSTLNRAQRRARARHIMKQQRRVATVTPVMEAVDGNIENDRRPDLQHLLLDQQQHDEDIPPFHDDSHLHANGQHLLSRKERQKAAKQVELQERRFLEEDRRIEQQKAQEAAISRRKEKERILAARAEQERKQRQEQKEADELAKYRAWKIFLSAKDYNHQHSNKEVSDDSNNNINGMITVKRWIRELKQNRIVILQDLADRFQLEESVVHDRIKELLDTSRLSGILETSSLSNASVDKSVHDDDDNETADDGKSTIAKFIYVSPVEIYDLSLYVKAEDKFTAKDFAVYVEEQLALPALSSE